MRDEAIEAAWLGLAQCERELRWIPLLHRDLSG
jgi:hypothetical protein